MMKKSRKRNPLAKLLLGFVAAACVLGAGATSLWAAGGPHYTGWSEPVNLGPTISTTFTESGPAISKNRLSLYFYSTRPGGFGGNDIWVSQRESVHDAWGTPANLGPTVNSASSEFVPAFSRDGHWMFFGSDRPGGFGLQDIWASWRPKIHDDFGWQTPTNLGPGVNSAADDNASTYFKKKGAPQLIFGSGRLGGAARDLFLSNLQADGTWGPATLIPELSSPSTENRPTIRRDGLEIFFYSDRPGGSGGNDIWVATRDTVDAPWSTPVTLGAPVNTSAVEQHPYLASNAKSLFFSSTRPGSAGLDLYVTTRSKSHGHG
jgi:Tol biopolymer transport system component